MYYLTVNYCYDGNSNSKTVPRIGGVVVFTQHAELVWDAANNIVDDHVEKSESKRVDKIIHRWQRLVGSLMSLQALRQRAQRY